MLELQTLKTMQAMPGLWQHMHSETKQQWRGLNRLLGASGVLVMN